MATPSLAHLDISTPPLPLPPSFKHHSVMEPLLEPPPLAPPPLPWSPTSSCAARFPPALHAIPGAAHRYIKSWTGNGVSQPGSNSLLMAGMVDGRHVRHARSGDAAAEGASSLQARPPSSTLGMLCAGEGEENEGKEDDGSSAAGGSFLGSMQGHVGGFGGAAVPDQARARRGLLGQLDDMQQQQQQQQAMPGSMHSSRSSSVHLSGQARDGGSLAGGVAAFPMFPTRTATQQGSSTPGLPGSTQSSGGSLGSAGDESARRAVLDELMGAQVRRCPCSGLGGGMGQG